MRIRRSHIFAKDPHNFYIEPSWCSERLFESEKFDGSVLDPSCGTGRVVDAARRAGLHAMGGDIVRRCRHAFIADFLSPEWRQISPLPCPDNIVSNPPFDPCNKIEDGVLPYVDRCLSVANKKIALLLPFKWASGDDRSRYVETTPLYRIRVLTPRPSMPPGAYIEAGGKAAGGKEDFAWFIWLQGYDGPSPLHYCRRDR